jgi:hypothetical protein
LLHWGAPAKAEIALIRAIMSEPADVEAYYHLGHVFLLRGEAESATKYFRLYVQESPDGIHRQEAQDILEKLEQSK